MHDIVRQNPVARLEWHQGRVGVVAASAIPAAFGAVTNKPGFGADTLGLVTADVRGAWCKFERSAGVAASGEKARSAMPTDT